MAKPTYRVALATTSLTAGIVAAWPLNEGAGPAATDVVGGAVLDCSGAGVSWNASPLGLLTVGSSSLASVATPAAMKLYPSSQPEITMLWLGQILGAYADFGGCCSVGHTSYTSYAIFAKTSTSHVLYAAGNAFKDGAITFVSGAAHTLILRQTAGIMKNTFDGAADGGTPSNNLASGITYGAGSQVVLGNNVLTNFRHDLMVIWNRSISDAEVTAMGADPWQIFVPAAFTSPTVVTPIIL